MSESDREREPMNKILLYYHYECMVGFICEVVVLVDILLAFNLLTQLESDSSQFSMEVQ